MEQFLGRTGLFLCFFFNDPATTEIYTLSLHDALPILVHGHDDVELAAARAGEERVRRQWAVNVEPLAAPLLDGGDDLDLLLVAEEPILARMRVEAADGDLRVRLAQAFHSPLGKVDDA